MNSKEFNSKLRLLKIKIINDELNIKFNRDRYLNIQKKLKLLGEEIEDYILTGSAVLYMIGWLDRLPNDYDIILSSDMVGKYSDIMELADDKYRGFDEIDDNRIGTIDMALEIDRKLDFFSKIFSPPSTRKGYEHFTLDVFENDIEPYYTIEVDNNIIKIDECINH